VGGRLKVYIYDECHMLSAAANNALLKILEEPPAHVVFVFATTEPHKVLPTLLDRCQRYEFRPIEAEELERLVAGICEAEQVAISDDALATVASRAAGSARDALTLIEQLVSFAGDKVTLDDVRAILGSVPEDVLFEAVDVISDRDVAGALSFADRLIRSGRDIREFTRALVDHLRSLFLIVHAAAPQEILDVSDERLERLRSQANRFDSGELLRLLDLANEIQLTLRQAIEGRLALEIGFARMTRPDLHSVPASMLARIERLERLVGVETGSSEEKQRPRQAPPSREQAVEPRRKAPTSRPAKKQDPRATPERALTTSTNTEGPAGAAGVDTEKVQQAWDVILQKVKSRKVTFGAVLIQARPAAFVDGELVLEFGPKSNWHRDEASDPAKQIPLIEAFHDTFGIRPRIRCVELTDKSAPVSPAEPDELRPVTSARDSSETAGADPVDMMRERFSAEVVEDG
jgi:DNA polymerase-3 subunit gamma/tau